MQIAERIDSPLLHPLHAILLAFPVAFFAGGLAFDITYLRTAVIQWSNFASWLIAGASFFGGLVLVWALARALFPGRVSRGQATLYLVLIAVMWIAGLVNAFQHSRDGWSSVGAVGVTLSVISTFAALAAAWIGHSARAVREVVP
jgi:uncharacterized membrane protein